MQPDQHQTQTQTREVSFDAGLRAHMQRVYNRMTVGVLITAITAAVIGSSPALMMLFMGGPQAYIFMFAPIAVLWFGFNPMTMPSSKLKISFIAISALYGVSFSTIGYIFAGEDIARAFFIASGMFAGLSIFGYTTKKNLDSILSFVVMGVWGVFIMSILNGFIFKNAALFDMISVMAIIAFAGLTAWQTQSMKQMYNASNGDEANSRMGWAAALNLYISFIALFMHILHLIGGRE
jgi:FtsH-binding integral membrane protein